MSRGRRRRSLERQAAQAARRLSTAPTGDVPLDFGDLYTSPITHHRPVEWLALCEDPELARRWIFVPADTNPLAGNGDLVLPHQAGVPPASLGPLTLRCGHSLSVSPTLFDSRHRTGKLDAGSLFEARGLWIDLRTQRASTGPRSARMLGNRAGSTNDPDYEDWIQEIVEPALEALATAQRGESRTPSTPRSGPRRVEPPKAPERRATDAPETSTHDDLANRQSETRGARDDGVAMLSPTGDAAVTTSRRQWSVAASALLFTSLILGSVAVWKHLQVRSEQRIAEQRIAELEAAVTRAKSEASYPRSGPLANIVPIMAEARGQTRGSGPSSTQAPSGAAHFLITLAPPLDREIYDLYAIDLFHATAPREEKPLWASGELRTDPMGQLNFLLPNSEFSAATYRADLYGIENGKRTPLLQEYRFSIE